MLEILDAYWSGERWRLVTFFAGCAGVLAAIVLAFVVSVVTGERLVPLILLFLVSSILAASLIGSGIIDTLSSQMNRGGLARESTEDIDKALKSSDSEQAKARDKERRDVRTVRAGLFVIAPIIAFVYFMTIV